MARFRQSSAPQWRAAIGGYRTRRKRRPPRSLGTTRCRDVRTGRADAAQLHCTLEGPQGSSSRRKGARRRGHARRGRSRVTVHALEGCAGAGAARDGAPRLPDARTCRSAPPRGSVRGDTSATAPPRRESTAARRVSSSAAEAPRDRGTGGRPDPQDAREVEEAQRAPLGRPGRDDPAWGVEREGEHLDIALGRVSLRVTEADAGGPRGELGAREAQEGAQLPGAVHGDMVKPARTRAHRGDGARGRDGR